MAGDNTGAGPRPQEGFPQDYVIEQHKALMNAALSRNVEASMAAMTNHIGGNAAILVKLLSQDGRSSP